MPNIQATHCIMPANKKPLLTASRTVRNGDESKPIVWPPWTFLSNHAHVLFVLHSQPELVLREVALRVGITERAVQRIVHELEEEGFLTRERVGRCNRYHINKQKHLRHPVESHCTIEQILKLVTGSGTNGRKRRSE